MAGKKQRGGNFIKHLFGVCVCVYIYIYVCVYAHGVMVIVLGNGDGNRSSNPDETDCISHSTNTLGKGINPIILPPAMGK